MKPGSQRKQQTRFIIGVTIFLVVALLVVLIITAHKSSRVATSSHARTSYDANSGETVRTIPGENTSGTASNVPLLLGTSALLERGITTDQLTNTQTAFLQYKVKNSLSFKQVSITVNSIKSSTINPDTDPVNVLDFPVVLDGKTTLEATLQYSSISTIELFLKDASGSQVFDSGIIDTQSPSS